MFEELWQLALTEYDRLKGIDWKWQSMDGAMTKSPLGGEKKPVKTRPIGHVGRETFDRWSMVVECRWRSPAPMCLTRSCWPRIWMRSRSNVLSPRLTCHSISVSTKATRASPSIVKFASEAIRLTSRPRRINRPSPSIVAARHAVGKLSARTHGSTVLGSC